MKIYFFRRAVLCALLFALMFLLGGCRVRTTGTSQSTGAMPDFAADVSGNINGESSVRIVSALYGSDTEDTLGDADSAGQTRENPESERKEYDTQADAEIEADAEKQIGGTGSGDAPAEISENSEISASLLDVRAEQTATQILPAETAERMGISEDAEAADTAMNYYTVLLEDRLSSLFECKRLNVYWESVEDHVTVYRTSPEHLLILESGCYDVSARLTEERLQVDDGWVVRKNPDIIVKAVDSSVLGSTVYGTARSAQVRSDLMQRQDWQNMNAVKNGKILLISSEMLEEPYLQLCIRLAIAKMAYPDLMQDVEIGTALQMLSEEAAGILAEAEYFDFGE